MGHDAMHHKLAMSMASASSRNQDVGGPSIGALAIVSCMNGLFANSWTRSKDSKCSICPASWRVPDAR